MTLRSAFHDLLSGDSDISGQVGARVYHQRAPQNPASPYLTYQVISDRREDSLGGDSRIRHARIQVDAWAGTDLSAETVMGHVTDLLDGKSNTQSGIKFASAWLVNETDLYEDSVELYRISADFEIAYWSTS